MNAADEQTQNGGKRHKRQARLMPTAVAGVCRLNHECVGWRVSLRQSLQVCAGVAPPWRISLDVPCGSGSFVPPSLAAPGSTSIDGRPPHPQQNPSLITRSYLHKAPPYVRCTCPGLLGPRTLIHVGKACDLYGPLGRILG